ncbi:hypothetical protein ACHAXT_009173 [Thalassiosira profunda]
MNDGFMRGDMSSFLITRSMSPYSTASSGCRYFTLWQSSMTVLSGFPVACAISSHDVLRLCATSRARMAMSDACPCACDLGWLSKIVAFGRAARPPFWPCERIIAAAPNACPIATVLTGGRMYFITSAMAKASVSKPTACPPAVVVPLELMYIVTGLLWSS